jgi:bifunctional DNA-binding transcriptional regulator/antitoxin component of YhaV-PrlF toxin-antitoxin module
MGTKVRISETGTLTLPPEVLERYRIKPGDTLELLEVDDALVLALSRLDITDLALEIEAALIDAGITMAKMLAGLREERKRYVAERYGIVEE